MCLMCQEEDLYFLYLEQMEREAKAARGEVATTQANWMWPSFAKSDAISVPADPAAPAKTNAPAATPSAFVCDDPDSE
jgi:hypothetical protein